jgi:hypothetical protein
MAEDFVVLREKHEVMPHSVDDLSGFIDFNLHALLLTDFRNVQEFLHFRKNVQCFIFIDMPLVPEFLYHSFMLIFSQPRGIGGGRQFGNLFGYRVHKDFLSIFGSRKTLSIIRMPPFQTAPHWECNDLNAAVVSCG